MVLSGVPAALVLVTPGRFSLNRNQINIVLSVNHSGSDEADQSSDAWMAELLQNCGYENNIEALNGWQAVQANPDVYLEAVETVKDA